MGTSELAVAFVDVIVIFPFFQSQQPLSAAQPCYATDGALLCDDELSSNSLAIMY